jgi:crossover junction endodeoxyribonuclease RuvC
VPPAQQEDRRVSESRLVLGVDPGLSGALALVDPAGPALVDVLDMPLVRFGKAAIVDGAALLDWLDGRAIAAIVIEAVASRPGQGVASSFAFGRAVGGVEAVLAALGPPVTHVTPQQWKRRAGLAGAKADSLALARLRFGARDEFRLEKHEGRAEAALIALYGRRT